ncbi:hypothetical protein FOS14_07290 [Skermania sp. ID1734]|uniref:hypothetical protein n=1 Tax=Skermania sp. ID1734 TaxID=2597516 RepID=UPI00117DEDBD|nr:hypothetical protein [Skermania sp. ID1734]TSE00801.1 hypothetical protein FOS14_07290 [Skermania sp. ID1734]
MDAKKTAARASIAFIALPVLLLTGCNKGGDTACGDYLKASGKDQTSIIQKWAKDRNGSEPSGLKLTAYREEVKAYCTANGGKVSDVGDLNDKVTGKVSKKLGNLLGN